MPKSCVTEPDRLAEHRLEHRREVARGGIDHLQYLSDRSLLLQCLARFNNEPRILDRDNSLIGENLEECDLLSRERLATRPEHAEDPDAPVLAQEGHAEHGAEVAEPLVLRRGELGIFQHVADMHEPPFARGAPSHAAGSWR